MGVLAALLLARPAPAGDFEVSGHIVPAEGALRVRVTLKNRSQQPAVPVAVEGEFLELFDQERLAAGLKAGESGDLDLVFPVPPDAREGVHLLALHIEHPAPGAAEGTTWIGERGYLLLALGGTAPPPALQLDVPETELRDEAIVPLRISSLDGRPHRARVRTLVARGLTAQAPAGEVEVPASGSVLAPIRLLRSAGAPRPSTMTFFVAAVTTDGALARTSVSLATTHLVADPALLPRLRPFLIALGLALLGAGGAVEAWRMARRPA
jgi:hypothetical protein